jgi:integrase
VLCFSKEWAPKVAPENMTTQKRKWGEVTVYWNEEKNVWYYRCQYRGVRYKRSTDVRTKSDKPTALKVARRLAKAIQAGDTKTQDEISRQPGFATVKDVVDKWKEKGPKSARAVAGRFERYVSEEFETEAPDGRGIDQVLRADRFRKWIEKQVAAERAAAGIRSDVNSIKSMFAPSVIHYYEEFHLPDVTAFRAVAFKPRRRGTGAEAGRAEPFRVIEAKQLAAMEAEAERLRVSEAEQDRRVWAVFALMRWCGLRNNETMELRWDWVREGAKGPLLDFIKRKLADGSVYEPKGRDGSVPIRRELLEQLRQAFGDVGEFVIPRLHKTDAEELYQRTINEWSHRFLKNRPGTKVSYALRGQFGAEVAMRSGIEVASRMLRHASIQTTWAHYHDLVSEPDPL